MRAKVVSSIAIIKLIVVALLTIVESPQTEGQNTNAVSFTDTLTFMQNFLADNGCIAMTTPVSKGIHKYEYCTFVKAFPSCTSVTIETSVKNDDNLAKFSINNGLDVVDFSAIDPSRVAIEKVPDTQWDDGSRSTASDTGRTVSIWLSNGKKGKLFYVNGDAAAERLKKAVMNASQVCGGKTAAF